MALSSRTLKLKITLIKKASNMNFLHPILQNKMEWLKERMTLIESSRTMLNEYMTFDCFWAKAINTACHILNWLYLH
jgi:hypothetical protein